MRGRMEILLFEDNMGAPSEKSKRVGRTNLDKEKVLEQKEYQGPSKNARTRRDPMSFPDLLAPQKPVDFLVRELGVVMSVKSPFSPIAGESAEDLSTFWFDLLIRF